MNRRSFIHSTATTLGSLVVGKAAGIPQTQYRACVIGDSRQGGYGHNLHLMWELVPEVEVVGLADPDPEGLQKRAGEARARRTYSDYREMLEQEKPDLVSIGPRWTIHHKDYLLACASVRAHGIMEKPLATDLAEADVMLETVRAANLKWALAFNFRASPVMENARRMVMEEGLIGEVLEIRSRGKEDRRAGGEDLIVLGVHIFDLMVYFLGPPEWCSASILVDGRDAGPADVREATEPLGPVVGDNIQATYGFKNGVKGYFSSARNPHGDQGRWGMEIFGSLGVVTVRMQEIPPVFYLAEPSWAPGTKEVSWQPLPGAPSLHPGRSRVWHYEPIVTDLIRSIEQDRQPRASLQDGRMAHEMIQAVFQSHLEGASRVPIPLKERKHPLRHWS